MKHGVLSDSLRSQAISCNGPLPQNPEELSLEWSIVKRDGTVVPFNAHKIRAALRKCFSSVEWTCDWTGGIDGVVETITRATVNSLAAQRSTKPGVEDVQRIVIQQLWAEGLFDAAEHYQNYREQRRQIRIAETVSPAFAAAVMEDAARFPASISYYQWISKFARWREKDKRRETWREGCTRVMTWFRGLPKVAGKLAEEEWAELDHSLYAMETCCAMRVVQMAGPALERCHVGVYNCAALAVDCLEAFAEFLYVLMSGGGCGFSVEDRYISQLPRIKHQKEPAVVHTFVVPDTTEGWCDAILFGLQRWFDGEDVNFDTSKVRKKNARLKTKGGRSSGPEPLIQLLAFARNLILSRQGKVLTDLDCHDLCCMEGKIVQVGGVRRAATISVSDLTSLLMRGAKDGPWYTTAKWRTMANNSAAYDGRPDINTFMAEFASLIRSESGERGIFNRKALNDSIPERRAKIYYFLPNPCQPGFATVLTLNGIKTFADIAVGSEIWSGKRWTKVVRKISTGVKPVFRYVTTAGCFIGTDDHQIFSHGERIRAGDAEEIDVCQGPINGNPYPSFDDQSVIDGTRITPQQLPRTWDKEVPEYYRLGTSLQVRSFLRGLYDANGSVCGTRVTLKAASLTLIRQVQEMLSSLGIVSHYTTNPATAITRPDGQVVTSRENYDLNITHGRMIFRDLIGFIHRDKAEHLDEACRTTAAKYRKRHYEVIAVEPLGEMPVYDITVEDDEHSYWTGGLLVSNCGEINLRPCQFCNLSIVVARPWDTEETLARKVRIAAYWGCMQKTATDFKYLRPIWKENCEEEALLGVDITGHADCPLLRYGAPGRAELLRKLKKIVEEVDIALSARFGVNRSAANTCVKPSGDSAVFFDCASGTSPWFAEYIMRWVREPMNSPVAEFLRAEGVPNATAPEDDALSVFGFLRRAPAGATVAKDMTAVDQLENWLEWKENWAEHSVSCTVYVDSHEWPSVLAWVWDHFDKISGVSFLPRDNGIYTYVPNEAISLSQYEEAAVKFPVLNWCKMQHYESEDMTTSASTPACVAGSCELT